MAPFERIERTSSEIFHNVPIAYQDNKTIGPLDHEDFTEWWVNQVYISQRNLDWIKNTTSEYLWKVLAPEWATL